MQRRHILGVNLLLIIVLSCSVFYFSMHRARLDVSGFPSPQNYGSYTAFGPLNEAGSYAIINNTYQVHNVGNVNANNVLVKFKVYPADPSKTCKVISTSVYAGEPSSTNLLVVVKDKGEYTIDTLNVGARIIFVFQVKLTNFNSDTKYVLSVTSFNAGSFYREVLSQAKYGSTIHEQRWPWW
jgi:hypothetical protein